MANNWTNVTDAAGFLQLANNNTNDLFWSGMLVMIWMVLLISMLPFGFGAAILASCFGALMIGIVMAYMGLATWSLVVMFVGGIVGMILWIMYTKKE